ncbi:MAG: hypothetical protein O2894_13345 [Planctomycetota bacterium]|nr:hypothetical protein [Planctomycetota bacterium]
MLAYRSLASAACHRAHDRARRGLIAAAFLLGALAWGSVPARADDDEGPPEPPPVEAPANVEDVIVHVNGSVWSGRILQESSEEVVLERVSKSGGVGRITFSRDDIRVIRRGSPQTEAAAEGGPRLVREEWFLLRSAGRIVGPRHLELLALRLRGEPGFRIEEALEYFAQGPQLPATRTQRTEEVDQRFLPRLLAYREEGDASRERGGRERYARSVAGRVRDGTWIGASSRGGENTRCEVVLPPGARGPLGTREHLLRMPRRVGLLDLRVLDPEREELVTVRAGFTSVTEDPAGRRPGHEFHWEQGSTRLISYFDRAQHAVLERIAEGIEALPVSREQAEAASEQAARAGADPDVRDVRLPEAGIEFTAPGPLWTWTEQSGSPGNTGWRVLGRLANPVLVTDVRVEWHPEETTSEVDPQAVEAWLLRCLRAVSPDIAVHQPRRELTGLELAWQIGLEGTLRDERVRTVAVVVDRPGGRVVLLLAGPAGAWEQVQPAVAQFVRSIRLL